MTIYNINHTKQSESCRIYQRCGFCGDCKPEWVYYSDDEVNNSAGPSMSGSYMGILLIAVVATHMLVPPDEYFLFLKEYAITAAIINLPLLVIHYIVFFYFMALYYLFVVLAWLARMMQ